MATADSQQHEEEEDVFPVCKGKGDVVGFVCVCVSTFLLPRRFYSWQ